VRQSSTRFLPLARPAKPGPPHWPPASLVARHQALSRNARLLGFDLVLSLKTAKALALAITDRFSPVPTR
jgi:hypothetical protein